MRGRDLFGVVVRSVGLTYAAYGIYLAMFAISPGEYASSDYLVAVGGAVVAGVALMMAAEWIASIAYWNAQAD
jgi:hypothetical protein